MTGEGRVAFVAEVSSNHGRDLQRCLAFVDGAADIGCDAVKFQLFRVRELFAPEVLARSAEHRRRAAWELPLEFLAPLAERCRGRGLQFGCSPFSLEAVEALAPHVDFLKVSSYELGWAPLLQACATQGKPVVLSTGMAERAEVARAVEVLDAAGCQELALLHCVSGYPTPPRQANLAAIETLRSLLDARMPGRGVVGWSDHTVEPGVIQRAVHRFGARMIEFHLDLDGRGEEFATGHCWLPDAVREVIRQVRVGEDADGDGDKRPAPCEEADRAWRADPMDGLRPRVAVRRQFVA